jgi:hypothetical protein
MLCQPHTSHYSKVKPLKILKSSWPKMILLYFNIPTFTDWLVYVNLAKEVEKLEF